MPAVSKAQAAWCAGIFEGEGSFSYHSGKFGRRVMARMTMSDKDVVNRFAELVGVGKVYGPFRWKIGTKDMWTWQVTSFENVQHVIAILWRWLGIRRRARASEVLTLAKDMKLGWRMRSLP